MDSCIIVPKSLNLDELPEVLLSELKRTHVVRFEDRYFLSTRTYDFLMMSNGFYSAFLSFTYILICQLDALILSVSQLQKWLKQDVSYVGAPWFYGCDKPKSTKLAAVGNGGFSLRNIRDHIFAIENIGRVPPSAWIDLSHPIPDHIHFMLSSIRNLIFSSTDGSVFHLRCHEDYFFGIIVPSILGEAFNVPSPYEAISFAYEVNPKLLHNWNNFELPAGCHAWDRYDAEFWLKRFEEIDHIFLDYLKRN